MLLPVNKRIESISLDYQGYIEHSPRTPQSMYEQSCSNDKVTIDSWRDIWINNIKSNKERFEFFKEFNVGQLFGKYRNQSILLAGSGPSLKYNGKLLAQRGEVPLISCLHNFHYFVDNNIPVDYFVSLDAGAVVLEEISEGGTKSTAEYWEATSEQTLIAFIGSNPELFKRWRGKVYLFNVPVPDKTYKEEVDKIEPFHAYISSGGNVLGACLYVAKAIFGCTQTAFVGADFSFSYNNKFHGWDSKYDKDLGKYMVTIDIFGNKIKTWKSYYNFANWFNYIAENVPGIYINCTEGGIFGAYLEGNIMSVKQMPLSNFINMSLMYKELQEQFENPEKDCGKILF